MVAFEFNQKKVDPLEPSPESKRFERLSQWKQVTSRAIERVELIRDLPLPIQSVKMAFSRNLLS
jgi:hypothetical protein